MPIDRDKALNADPGVREIGWTTRDVLLYHLSLGAGATAATDPELHLTYEKGLTVLPTFALVAGTGISAGQAPAPGVEMPGIDVDLRAVLHAGQGLTVHRPLPAAGTATLRSRVAEVWDKGKAALVVLESAATGPDGEPLWTTTTGIWVRGEGGFGGEPGPEERWRAPDRAADAVLTTATTPQQALWYRLNGDLNPLHADPAFARSAGFEQPVLHGLASYGLLAKALVDGVLDGDVTRLTGLTVRFAGPLVPGESITTSVWRDAAPADEGTERLLLHAACPDRDGAPVLTHATATVRS
ncbi:MULTISPECIES: MaoC/PaaZ C-terminal domain-containing protein [Streptomyces]|uniref:3-alpha,7-alpha, 12-alpha-trihydroxy-5-beta-choles t-24-enoyl-CoA hydratase n=3 Tax=Streptomyces TaxID=1883 RepID=A0A8H9LQ49_9ACTN|nr:MULTISPECIES: MaoC/PaaZ C-terminal domain-containing protein [Streptomyces]NEE48783.1 3-alpha,7-alpha,12-alpha-trihydroxy-5-beta-cholest-24-enoyl-CoA hydratase [Streptomyces sp. SID8455]MDQ0297404.1 acyl dehydratase [Streptomyces sp. DSM 41037]QNE79810.1 3-alpha,7-alpha,12-alpha-trihydroxy-5-beta-cholest-24-enoyl-CoA hydratase [Streptomyces rutgersensis]WPR49837.1 MaoC/PaaZ C-terminal domain-containing protein [Streptomyces sp. S399]WSU39242.1 MaoC/PaaZ C-terminal domain-containing protein 